MSSANRIINPTGGALDRVNLNCPQIGVVKGTIDGETMGRLKVWIKGSNTLETDPSGWITVNYGSPFAGASDPETLGNNPQKYTETQKSYGFWAVPPDNNNEVIVVFINGDARRGYWIGCLFQKDMNHMVPGIPNATTFQNSQYGGDVPSSEYNKTANSSTVRPYYEPLTVGLETQGLISDSLRGGSTSGARRESPSQVFGILTPSGNQFVMDDGVNNQLIRLRTASGAQILISETEGHVYAISRDGKSWGELNVDGNVDFYAGAGCNFHAVGDFNVTAGGNINFDAGGNINVKAKGNVNVLSIGNLNLTSNTNASLSISGNYVQAFGNTVRKWQAPGALTITDNFPHPNIINNGRPSAQTPTLNTQSIKTSTGQEAPKQTVTSRVPDAEPWAPHAATGITTPAPVEGDYAVSTGNVVSDAVTPLPVVGSPTSGMKQGVYVPQGYDKNSKPVYTYAGSTTELSPVANLTVDKSGQDFIISQEGFVNTVYDDAGKRAIGVGHDIIPSDPPYVLAATATKGITDQQVYELLASDLKKTEQTIKKYVKVKLTQAQFNALASFIFNLGGGAFAKSTLLKELNQGNYSDVPNQLMRWVHAKNAQGQTIIHPGLVKRRRAEGLLFATPAATTS